MERRTLTITYFATHYRHKLLATSEFEVQLIILGLMVLVAALVTNSAVDALQTETTANILLTEIFYDTPGTDADEEWVELANFGLEEIALSDYKLGDEERFLKIWPSVRIIAAIVVKKAIAILVGSTIGSTWVPSGPMVITATGRPIEKPPPPPPPPNSVSSCAFSPLAGLVPPPPP